MPTNTAVHRTPTRLAVGLTVNLGVAALHVANIRAMLSPELRPLFSGYFSDVAIPFAFYYLLCFVDDRVPLLRPSLAKAGAVLLASTAAELLQGIGIPLLGRTFDPLDIAAYACGVTLAAALDRLVLTRLLSAWPLTPHSDNDAP